MRRYPMDRYDLGDSYLTLMLTGSALGIILGLIVYWLKRKGP